MTNPPVGTSPDPSRMANRSVGTSPNPTRMASGHRFGCPDPDAITASRRLSVAGRSRTRLPKYRKTSEVYGQSHDIQPAVVDKATVSIYYESRIAKLSLNEAELPKVDSEFEDITAGEEEDRKQKLKTKWAPLEALVGSEKRIRLIADGGEVTHGEAPLKPTLPERQCLVMSRNGIVMWP